MNMVYRLRAKKSSCSVLALLVAFFVLAESISGFSEELIVVDGVGPVQGLAPKMSMDSMVQGIERELEQAGASDERIRREILNSISDPYGLKVDFANGKRIFGASLGEGQGITVIPEMQEAMGALIAAILVHVVETWRQTGKADWESVNLLLDSPELYAGLIGAGFGYGGVKFGGYFVKKVTKLDFAMRVAKDLKARLLAGKGVLARVLNSRAAAVVGDLVSAWKTTAGYMFAVELFAEYYRVATRDVDGAESLKKIIEDPHVRSATILSVLWYTLLDKQKQQEILQNAFMRRALSADFISMTVAIAVGAKLGVYLGTKTGSPVATFLFAALGAAVFGVGQGFIPQPVRTRVNVALDNQKIKWARAGMIDDVKTIRRGIESESYPFVDPEKKENSWGTWVDGNYLTADLAGLRRKRDLLLSLYFKQYLEYLYYAAYGELQGGTMDKEALANQQAYVAAIEKQIVSVFWIESVFLENALDKLVPSFDFGKTYSELSKTYPPEEALRLSAEEAKKHYGSKRANYAAVLRHYAETSAQDYRVVSLLIKSKGFLNRFLEENLDK